MSNWNMPPGVSTNAEEVNPPERYTYDRWLKDDGEKQWARCPDCDSFDVDRIYVNTKCRFTCNDCGAESLPATRYDV